MRHAAAFHVLRTTAITAGCLFLTTLATHASAANTQAVCAPTLSPNVNSCSLDLGSVSFTAPNLSFSNGVVHFDGGTAYMNLAQTDIVSTANGPGVTFNPAYSQLFGGSGYYETPSGQLRFAGVETTAAAGFVLNSVTVRFEGIASITGPATFQAWPTVGTGQTVEFRGPGEHAFDLSYTLDAAQLGPSIFPTLVWAANLPYGQGPNGTATVSSMLNLSFNKMTLSASVSPVPEASTFALMALGLLVVVGRSRACRMNLA